MVAKKIIDLAQNALATNSTRSPKKTSPKKAIPISWISGLFKRLQARYGTRWVASIEGIEELAVNEWSEGLAGFTGRDIKRGLANLSGEWPPSLPQFKAACIGQKDWRHQEHASNQYVSLPKPQITKEQQDKRRAELKATVKGFRKPEDQDEKDKFVSDPEKRQEIEDELKKLDLL